MESSGFILFWLEGEIVPSGNSVHVLRYGTRWGSVPFARALAAAFPMAAFPRIDGKACEERTANIKVPWSVLVYHGKTS
jgi:hypothetical protein